MNLIQSDIPELDAPSEGDGGIQEQLVFRHADSFRETKPMLPEIKPLEKATANGSPHVTLHAILIIILSGDETTNPWILLDFPRETPEYEYIGAILIHDGTGLLQRTRRQLVIRIDKRDIIPRRHIQTGISRSRYPPVGLLKESNAGIGFSDDFSSPIRGSIIYHDDLHCPIHERIQTGRKGDRRIESRNDNAYSHTFLLSPMKEVGSFFLMNRRISPSYRLSRTILPVLGAVTLESGSHFTRKHFLRSIQ